MCKNSFFVEFIEKRKKTEYRIYHKQITDYHSIEHNTVQICNLIAREVFSLELKMVLVMAKEFDRLYRLLALMIQCKHNHRLRF